MTRFLNHLESFRVPSEIRFIYLANHADKLYFSWKVFCVFAKVLESTMAFNFFQKFP